MSFKRFNAKGNKSFIQAVLMNSISLTSKIVELGDNRGFPTRNVSKDFYFDMTLLAKEA